MANLPVSLASESFLDVWFFAIPRKFNQKLIKKVIFASKKYETFSVPFLIHLDNLNMVLNLDITWINTNSIHTHKCKWAYLNLFYPISKYASLRLLEVGNIKPT